MWFYLCDCVIEFDQKENLWQSLELCVNGQIQESQERIFEYEDKVRLIEMIEQIALIWQWFCDD